MGDSGEGLIDQDSRIQERMEELARAKADRAAGEVKNPEAVRELESLRLARKELERQLETTTHDRRRAQITQAIGEIDKQAQAVKKRLGK